MNYEKIYHNIINNRLNNPVLNEYTECHHILPKSVGGTDDKSNLVNLLAREHFICHLLLTKMYKEGSSEWIKMIKAFMMMYQTSNAHFDQRYSDNKWYEYLKTNFSKAQSFNQSGKGNSQYGTCWVSDLKNKKCIKIKQDELQKYLDNGWIKKRIINWNKVHFVNGKCVIFSKRRLEQYTRTRKKEEDFLNYYNKLYEIYQEKGFKGVQEYGYKYSFPNLVQMFNRYVLSFKKHQGKKRIDVID